MDERLEGCRLRLIRADEHLTFLDREIGTFLANVDRHLVGHFDCEASEYVFSVRGKPPPPIWGIIVGEFAHHMTALLDELVWRLVELRGGTPKTGARGSGFPILDQEGKWKTGFTKCKVAGLSADDRAVIESVQPYHFRKPTPDSIPDEMDMTWAHPLFQLDAINNADKHHFLQPAFFAPSTAQPVAERGAIPFLNFEAIQDTGPFDPLTVQFARRRPYRDLTEILRLPLPEPGPNPRMEMKYEVALVVSLKDGDPFYDLSLLREIRAYVEEQVLKPLAPVFD